MSTPAHPLSSSSGSAPPIPSQAAKPKKKPAEGNTGSSIGSADGVSPTRSSFGGQMVNLNKPLPKPPSSAPGTLATPVLSVSDAAVSATASPPAQDSGSRIAAASPLRPTHGMPATPLKTSDSGPIAGQSSPTSGSANQLLPPPLFGPPPVPPVPSATSSPSSGLAGKVPPPVPARRADLTLTRSRPGSPARSNRASISSPSTGAAIASMIEAAGGAHSSSSGTVSPLHSGGVRLSSEMHGGRKDRSESVSSERSDASQPETPHATSAGDSSSAPATGVTPSPPSSNVSTPHNVTNPSAASSSSSGPLLRPNEPVEDRKRAKSNPLASLLNSALRPGSSSSSSSSTGSTVVELKSSNGANPSISSGGVQASSSGGSSGGTLKPTSKDDSGMFSKIRRSIVGNRDSVSGSSNTAGSGNTSANAIASTDANNPSAEPNWYQPTNKPHPASAPGSLRSPLSLSNPSSLASANASGSTTSPSSGLTGSSISRASWSAHHSRTSSSDNLHGMVTIVPVPDRPPPPPPVFSIENNGTNNTTTQSATSSTSSLPPAASTTMENNSSSNNGGGLSSSNKRVTPSATSENTPTPNSNLSSNGAEIESANDVDLTPEQLEARNFKRLKVISELVDTERDYVMDLEAIVTVFLNPLLARGAIIPKHEIAAIFSNIDTIFHLNQQLLSRFQSSSTGIGHSFVSMADGLKSYSYFMANQTGSAAALERLRANAEFQQFLQQALADPMCRNSNLDNLLIKPVQRICKYPLLLDQLLRYTSASDPDYTKLLQAKKVIEAVCEFIDTSLNTTVNEDRLKEIDSTITGRPESFALVAPLRKFLREADMKVSVSGGIRPLHVFLFDDVLLIVKPQRGYDVGILKQAQPRKKPIFRWKDMVPLNELLLKEMSSLHLQLTHVGICQYTLLFDTADEKDSWQSELDTAVNNFLTRQYNEIYGKVAESERAPFAEFKRRLRKQLESIPLRDGKEEKSGKSSVHNNTWRRLEGDDDD